MSFPAESTVVKPAGLRKGARFYPELESLRGVAILLVLVFHTYSVFFGALKVPISPDMSLAFVQGGHTGVSLFFVLSAFLLGMPFIKAFTDGGPRPDAINFFKRRFLRIMPLYIVAVLIATIASKDIETGAKALFFGIEGNEIYPYSPVWWSLRVEVQFYILLPLIGAAIVFPKGRWILLTLLAVYLACYFINYVLVDPQSRIDGHSLFGRGIIFIIGLSAAYVYLVYGSEIREKTENTPLWKNGGSDALLLITIILLAALLNEMNVIGYFNAEKHYQYLHIPEGFLWAVILLIVLIFPLRLKIIIHNAFLSMLGIFSYSIYLNHFPIVFIGIVYAQTLYPTIARIDSFERIALAIALVLASVLFAGVTYHTIEKRFLKKKERLAS